MSYAKLLCNRNTHVIPGPLISTVATILGLVLLSACSNASPIKITATITPAMGEVEPTITPSVRVPPLGGNEADSAEVPPPPPLDPARVAQGKVVYGQHCAVCHGTEGEGHPDWQVPNNDGSFNPPPHTATGHTWHHPDDVLLDIIANGSNFPQTRMPTFGDKLTDEEILTILEYIKTWWGPEERAFQWRVTWQTRQQ